jgi:Fe-S cluster assembly iron-binding protein IscA
MLMLTENANRVISALVEQRPDLPNNAGLRIASAGGVPDESGLTLSTTETPHPGDQVIEGQQARVFLESDAAEMLDDKVLDAEVDDAGQVQFLVAPQ